MSPDPTASTASDLATSDPALLVSTDTTAAPVTAGEIAEFLRHLADLRTSGRDTDPEARAQFLHRKAGLFTRLDPDPDPDPDPGGPAGPPATGRRTP
ncbi:hypothetical protein [Pseudonocardia sp.]|uniref:hypothetical protein n=1 Tax=Pseudonocardia sp. TaxID=60912 RepID=UPI00261DC774|nr:hypothetical protein [Pseudonocardia sp.]